MASLEQLIGQVVRAGNYDLQFYAQWAEEAETATLTTQQATFWSQYGREQLLGGAGFGATMGDILEEWDNDAHGGEAPSDRAHPAHIAELEGECACFYQDLHLSLPCNLGGAVALPGGEESLAELFEAAGIGLNTDPPAAAAGLHTPRPCTFNSYLCHKRNRGTVAVALAQDCTFGELLRRIDGLWLGDEGVSAMDLTACGSHVQWETGDCKSSDYHLEGPG